MIGAVNTLLLSAGFTRAHADEPLRSFTLLFAAFSLRSLLASAPAHFKLSNTQARYEGIQFVLLNNESFPMLEFRRQKRVLDVKASFW
jgi:hypothetical protein